MNSSSLYQPPSYLSGNTWHPTVLDAVRNCSSPLSWDWTAILSIISFNYPSGDRTLLNEIKRQPWLSEMREGREPLLKEIPRHGSNWLEPQLVAERLEQLLMEEAEEACRERKSIYTLLSGGLDSRIVAGILAKLYRDGRIPAKPVALTWGLDDCRDVIYAKEAAKILGLEWIHLPLTPATLWSNIDLAARSLGALVSPVHLHAMSGLAQLDGDAIVLAGSYGDSIGRAEFSGRHVLELPPLRLTDRFHLIRPTFFNMAARGFKDDLKRLHARSAASLPHVLREHEMQGFYMRGMIAHAMNIINDYCSLHQMFTSQSVFGFIWSLHPVCRGDQAYAYLLARLDPELLRLPWARTNKALAGRTVGRQSNLQRHFHKYGSWIKGPLAAGLDDCVDPVWFSQIEAFDAAMISGLRDRVLRPNNWFKLEDQHAYELLLWLAGFRRFADAIVRPQSPMPVNRIQPSPECDFVSVGDSTGYLRRLLRQSPTLYKINKRLRIAVLKRKALRQIPPLRIQGEKIGKPGGKSSV